MTTNQAPAKKNFDDLLKIEGDKQAELVDGEIVMMAPASAIHSAVQSNLMASVRNAAKNQGPKIPRDSLVVCEAWVYYNNHNSFVHDVAAFDRSKIKKIPDKGPFRILPYWVAEVLSPSNWITDTEKKRLKLEEFGIPFYWIVNPREKILMVFELKKQGEHYQLMVSASLDDPIIDLPPFGKIDVRDIF